LASESHGRSTKINKRKKAHKMQNIRHAYNKL
jgi:hypothetical protein